MRRTRRSASRRSPRRRRCRGPIDRRSVAVDRSLSIDDRRSKRVRMRDESRTCGLAAMGFAHRSIPSPMPRRGCRTRVASASTLCSRASKGRSKFAQIRAIGLARRRIRTVRADFVSMRFTHPSRSLSSRVRTHPISPRAGAARSSGDRNSLKKALFIFRCAVVARELRACDPRRPSVPAHPRSLDARIVVRFFSRGVLTVEKSVIRFRPKRTPSRSE